MNNLILIIEAKYFCFEQILFIFGLLGVVASLIILISPYQGFFLPVYAIALICLVFGKYMC